MVRRVISYICPLASFEAIFILFLFANIFKSHPWLSFIPIDLTILLVFSGMGIAGFLWLQDEWKIKSGPATFLLFYLVFAGYATLSIIWSSSTDYALFKILRFWTVVAWAVFGMAFIIGSSHRRLKRFLLLLTIGGSLLSLVFIYQLLIIDVDGFSIGTMSYLLPARLVGVSALILLFFFVKYQNRSVRLVISLLMGLHTGALLVSGARGPLVALVGSIFVFVIVQLIYRTEWHSIAIRQWMADFTTFAAVGSILAGLVLTQLGIQFRTIQRAMRIFSDDEDATSFGARVEMYEAAISAWSQAPIHGHGIGSFALINLNEDVVHYPHNIMLEIGSELGLVGLLLFLVLVFISLLRLYRFRFVTDGALFALLVGFIVYWGLNASVTYDMVGNRQLFAFLALIFGSSYFVKPPNQQG